MGEILSVVALWTAMHEGMKALALLCSVIATAAVFAACDYQGNRGGDVSRTPAGTPERIDDGSAKDNTSGQSTTTPPAAPGSTGTTGTGTGTNP